jgi:hypothetical protein
MYVLLSNRTGKHRTDTNVQWILRSVGDLIALSCRAHAHSPDRLRPEILEETTMQTDFIDVATRATQVPTLGLATHTRTAGVQRCLAAEEFLFVQQSFRGAGGVASGDQVAYMLRERIEQPVSVVARWIVGREVVCYEWRSQTMLPLFQFDLSQAALRPSIAGVTRELRGVYADRCMALWFVEPNLWLDGATPLQMIELEPDAVLQAARADRWVANR